ncbi:MAG: 50S ribosomal protein L5 [Planctomycetota bacterium]
MAKGSKEQRPQKVTALKTEERPNTDVPPVRLQKHYRDAVVPKLKEQFGYSNLHAIPKLEKIVISMGLGKAMVAGDKIRMELAEKELTQIAGQKPVRTKAKKSVAGFKVREGLETGLMVTLRGARMYEFLDRLIHLAIPRVKDFRGLSPKSFDKQGNYNFGLNEQVVFPEIDSASATYQQGMNVTIATTAATPDEGRALLNGFDFPFRKEDQAA